MLRKQLIQFISPTLSMLILTVGNGFYTTLTTLVLKHHNISAQGVGWISAAYFIGLMLGSHFAQKTIIRVGHIRAYAVFASLMTVMVLVQGLVFSPILWSIFRFFNGYALAGLFVCIESWLLAASDDNTQGRMFAFYLFAYYIAQAASQLLVHVNFANDLMAFTAIGLVAVLSIMPVSLTRFSAPCPENMEMGSPWQIFKKAPLGVWASFAGGMVLGAIYTLYPLVILQDGLSRSAVADIMAVTLLGAASMQLPIGKWSDMTDRRRVILIVSLLVVLISVGGLLWHGHLIKMLVMSFILGGLTFTLYPLAMSHTGDYVSKSMAVSAISVLTVLYGVGSAVGPIVMPFYMRLHDAGFFLYLITVFGLLSLYTLYRITRREAACDQASVQFTPAQPEAQLAADMLAEQLDATDDKNS